MLDELQPNILKAHARDHGAVVFASFGDAAEGRAFLAAPANQLMKSAKTHLREVAAFKSSGTGGSPYVGVGLTAAGCWA